MRSSECSKLPSDPDFGEARGSLVRHLSISPPARALRAHRRCRWVRRLDQTVVLMLHYSIHISDHARSDQKNPPFRLFLVLSFFHIPYSPCIPCLPQVCQGRRRCGLPTASPSDTPTTSSRGTPPFNPPFSSLVDSSALPTGRMPGSSRAFGASKAGDFACRRRTLARFVDRATTLDGHAGRMRWVSVIS